MRRYKAVDINWDVDDPEDLNDLPTEIEIPEELSVDLDPNEPYLDDIDDYLFRRNRIPALWISVG